MSTQQTAGERVRVLMGHPSIHEFVRFVRTRAIDSHETDELALTREWQRANVYLRDLESSESRFADVGELEPLPDSIAALAHAELQDPTTTKCLSFLPYCCATVELDRLIVSQKYVNVDFARELRMSLPVHPTTEDLVGVATGRQRTPPALQVTTLGSNHFAFSSPSTDIRVLGAVALDPTDVRYQPYGHAGAAVAVFVGYGLNIMWAVHMGGRVMLVNGTHRAYALRAHGVTHAPCIVSRVSHKDEVDLAGLPDSKESILAYFNRARPPLLKDYFDERLFKPISVAKSTHIVELELSFDRTRSPAPAQ